MHPLRAHWSLDPSVTYLNHGSFGATPRAVLAHQDALRARMERNPMQFFVCDWERLHDEAREALGGFVGARGDDLAAVPNATAGVNAAVRAFDLGPGEEVVVTDHEYNACANALREAVARAGARVVVARVPCPLDDSEEVLAAVEAVVTPRTRFALIDHVSSQTALVFPVERIVRALRERGVETVVDGAHAPGMVPLDLDALGAAFYIGNLHKWACAPKGAAFVHVRRDLQSRAHPVVVSHGANSMRDDRARFRLVWDWTGTCDPTAFLSAPTALQWMASLFPGGWDAVRDTNRRLALRARGLLCETLGVMPSAPASMVGAMASVALPSVWGDQAPSVATGWLDPLQGVLREVHRIEVPVIAWPDPGSRWIRVSAQIYNVREEYELLAEVLRARGGTALTRARW